MHGDFYKSLKIPDMWSSPQERRDGVFQAKVLSVLFGITSFCLLVNLILTIVTDPGQIPEDPEWNMPEEKEDNESRKSLAFPQGGQPRPTDGASEGLLTVARPRDSVQSELSQQIETQNRLATGVLKRSRSPSEQNKKDSPQLEGGEALTDPESGTQSSETETGLFLEGGTGTLEDHQPTLQQIQEERFQVRQGSPKYNVQSED